MSGAIIGIDPEELDRRIESAVRRVLESAPAETPAEWIDARGAAELLGVCTRSIAKLAKAKTLRGSRLGKLWRFRRADVLALLEQRTG